MPDKSLSVVAGIYQNNPAIPHNDCIHPLQECLSSGLFSQTLGFGRLVPSELPYYLADPLMALPANHDVLALLDAKMAVAVHGACNDACLCKHHHRSRLGG